MQPLQCVAGSLDSVFMLKLFRNTRRPLRKAGSANIASSFRTTVAGL